MLTRPTPPHPVVFFFFFSPFALFVFIRAEAERSCGELGTPYPTLGNCNLSWEEGVSLGDLLLNNYSHDKPINQAALSPRPAPSLALGRNFDLFAMMLSHLQRAPLARKPDCGAPVSAGGPAEAEIPPQSQTRFVFLTVTEMKPGQMYKIPKRGVGPKLNYIHTFSTDICIE